MQCSGDLDQDSRPAQHSLLHSRSFRTAFQSVNGNAMTSLWQCCGCTLAQSSAPLRLHSTPLDSTCLVSSSTMTPHDFTCSVITSPCFVIPIHAYSLWLTLAQSFAQSAHSPLDSLLCHLIHHPSLSLVPRSIMYSLAPLLPIHFIHSFDLLTYHIPL